jgi:hypothetical protein
MVGLIEKGLVYTRIRYLPVCLNLKVSFAGYFSGCDTVEAFFLSDSCR